MLILAPIISEVKPADSTAFFAPIVVADPSDAFLDLNEPTDAEWDAMADEAAAMDAVCSGTPWL